MGNSICFCFQENSKSSSVKLIFWEGDTKILNGTHLAGEIMFESPEKMVCHADSFFIGHPIPALAIDDQLMPGQTYFVLPIEVVTSCSVLTASSLAKLISSRNKRVLESATAAAMAPMNVGDQCRPFEYIKGENGRALIKVVPEFMIRLINRGKENESASGNNSNSNNELLCSTPELKKHYDLLVGSREHVWSPKLETISEHNHNIRFSPCTLISLEWKQKQKAIR